MIMWSIAALVYIIFGLGVGGLVIIPAQSHSHIAPRMSETGEWSAYHAEAYEDYSAEFTALYEGYETKWSKNGRLMLRQGDSGPYKFVKKGAQA